MSLPLTTPADYTGVYAISTDPATQERLVSFISLYEREYITGMLSVQAYDDIENSDPLPDKYKDLINGNKYQDPDDAKKLKINRGFKEVLLSYIYAQWFSDNWSLRKNGKVRELNDNSEHISGAAAKQSAYSRRNMGADIYNCDTAPFVREFEELDGFIISSLEIAAGEYECVADTVKYLADGDEIWLDEQAYEVSNLNAAAKSFTISADSGLKFTGSSFSYEPFYDYSLEYQRHSFF